MDDFLSTNKASSKHQPATGEHRTNWNEVGHNRFLPPPTLRESLPWILLVLFLAGAIITLLVAVLSPPNRTDGPRYPLPSYVYLNGHCHHRSRVGIVPDELCEEVLSKPGSDGGRRPRFVYEQAVGVCYDTILDGHHKVPTEFCNRKPAAPDTRQ